MSAAGDSRPVARLAAWALASSDTAEVAVDRHPPLVEGDAANCRGSGESRRVSHNGGLAPTAVRSPAEPPCTGSRSLVGLMPTTSRPRHSSDLPWWSMPPTGSGRCWIHSASSTREHKNHDGAPAPLPRQAGFRHPHASIRTRRYRVTTAEIFDTDGFVGTSAQGAVGPVTLTAAPLSGARSRASKAASSDVPSNSRRPFLLTVHRNGRRDARSRCRCFVARPVVEPEGRAEGDDGRRALHFDFVAGRRPRIARGCHPPSGGPARAESSG